METLNAVKHPHVDLVQALNDAKGVIERLTGYPCRHVQWHQQEDGDHWLTVILEANEPLPPIHAIKNIEAKIAVALDHCEEKIGVIFVKGGAR